MHYYFYVVLAGVAYLHHDAGGSDTVRLRPDIAHLKNEYEGDGSIHQHHGRQAETALK